MRYAIVENNKCLFLENDRQFLVDGLEFIPEKTEADIVELADDAVVQGYDGAWYLAGFAPDVPADVALQNAKDDRTEAVEAITVEVDGLVFDGDETSQNRMARAVTMFNLSGFAPEYTTSWVLANGTVAQVTVAQLGQALLKAGLAQTALWTVPYEGQS